MAEQIRETASLREAKPADGPGRILVQLISPGKGASGHYSTEVLQEAATDRVWPRGTQMHLDHDSPAERQNRPEGSVKNLAAVLTEDARWSQEHNALVAEARVGSVYKSIVHDFAEVLGTSIVASAEVSEGEVDGEPTRIIERLLPGPFNRVDFVTVAGRGGKVAEVMESAKPVQEARSIGGWLEARLHQAFTNLADDSYGDGRLTREERITLSSAIGEALTVFVSRIEADAPQLYKRDLWDEPEAPVQAAESLTIPAGTTTERIAEAATAALGTQISVTPTGEEKEKVMPEIEETRLRELEESHGRVPVIERELAEEKQLREKAEHRAAIAEAKSYARDFAAKLVRETNSELSQVAVAKVVSEATKDIQLDENGRLDTAHLTEVTNKAREAEETYLAQFAEESGLGRVRGLGESESTEVSEAMAGAAVASLFGREVKGA